MLERYWKEVPTQSFVVNGTTNGIVTLSSTSPYKLQQLVVVLSPSLPSIAAEVKAIFSDTQMAIGPQGTNPNMRIDLSSYDTSATISAPEQPRPAVPTQDIERFTYEEAPIVARRVVPVDDSGNVLKFVKNPGSQSKSMGVAVDNLNFTPFSEAKVSDSLQGAAQGQNIIVTGTVATQALGGPSSLVNRKGIFIMPIDVNLYMGFNHTVTSANGIPVFVNQMVYVPAATGMQIWIISSSGSANARVWEVG
jgi:hypothetical protein